MSKRQIEMVWSCSSCGHQNLGRHALCQRCGNPKDASEAYVMPGDTASAASVTDPGLLRMAEAGVNWQCAYCGSHQRRFDGACAQCGAAQAAGKDAPLHTGPEGKSAGLAGQHVARAVAGPGKRLGPLVALLAIVTSCCGFCGIGSIFRAGHGANVIDTTTPKTHFIAEVTARRWERVITVERYQSVSREGFAESIPADAYEREARGQRHHHDEQVPDGFETQHYTERVQSGFDTESYTERVQCGQTCTARPQHCQEVCTPNGNGFATCEQQCSGGGEDCSPRYCDESRTRQVPRFVDEPRTRQVPRFRSEPRTAEWFGYRVWTWVAHRTVRAEGTGSELVRWPAPEDVRLGEGVGDGERERERRGETYTVELRVPARTLTLHPVTEAEFGRYGLSSQHFLRLPPGGGFTVEGPADAPEGAETRH
ncbi:MAG: hypothetical protein IPI43_15865 [Sandaracinaceae bacterium]|nr:hypothetical protein [Sandaracinaceae bacterium]